MTAEERLFVVCVAYQSLFDNWQEDGSFGRLIGRLRERLDLRGAEGVWEMVQCSGALSLHNHLPTPEERVK